MARPAEDYGIAGLDDETLRILAGNVRRYGEKGRYAIQELGQRRGLQSEADAYRAALQRATFQSLGPEFSQGLARITGSLAGGGPMADSGTANALRARLAGDIYGRAAGRIGGSYAEYLGDLLRKRREFGYQKQLLRMQQKANKKSPWSSILGAVGGIGGALVGGPAGAAVGSGIGSSVGGGIGGYPQGDFPSPRGYYG